MPSVSQRSVARRRARCSGFEFRELRLLACVDRRACAALLRVSERTIRNWERGVCSPPYSAFKLLRILRCFELPGDAWRGWYLKGDTLWSPEQRPFQPFDMGYWSLTVSMARSWMAERGIRSSKFVAPPRAARRAIDLKNGHLSGQREESSPVQLHRKGRVCQNGAYLTHKGANVCLRGRPGYDGACRQHGGRCPFFLQAGAVERARAVMATGPDVGGACGPLEGVSDGQAGECEPS